MAPQPRPVLVATYTKMVVYPFQQVVRYVGKYRRRQIARPATVDA